MMNRPTKKVAYALCISSIMSMTTVESMLYNSNNNSEHAKIVKVAQNSDDENTVQDGNNKNAKIVKYTQNRYEVENGLLGVKRDIFLQLSEILFRMKLRNVFDISGECVQWTNHQFYSLYRNNEDTRLKGLCRLLTNWENVPLNDIRASYSRMVCNEKTIVIANSDGIFHSMDGRTYERIYTNIWDIIVADGKYVAINEAFMCDNSNILISDDAVRWNMYQCNHRMIDIAYDELNKVYYGIDSRESGCNIYKSKNIAKLGKSKSKPIFNTSRFSAFHTCCGNGIYVVSLSSSYRNYYFHKDSLKRNDLKEIVFGMSYNKKSKCILAVTKLCSDFTSFNVYSTKNGSHWKKEINTKNDFNITCKHDAFYILNSNDRAVLTTIDDYSVLLIQPIVGNLYDLEQSIIHILIRKSNGEWMKISKTKDLGKNCTIKRITETNRGIFMLTSNDIKKAVGDIVPTLVAKNNMPVDMSTDSDSDDTEITDSDSDK